MTLRTANAVRRMAAQRLPTEGTPPAVDLRTQALQLLARQDLTSSPPNPVPSRPDGLSRRRLLVVAGTAAVAVAGSVAVYPALTRPTAYAATPPLLQYTHPDAKETPTDALNGLAELARKQPAPTGSGPFHYVHTQGWYLDTEQDTGGKVLSSRVDVSDRQLWLNADGTGRIEETRGGRPLANSGRYGRGGLAQVPVPAGPAESLRDRLLQQNPSRSTADWFGAVKDIWNTRAVPPELQSALLQVLATRPDIHFDGAVTDRAGRAGTAVSIDTGGAPATRSVLILGADTGTLLGYEEVALTAGDLPVQAPATIGYTLWLSSGRTPDTDTTPV